MLESDIRKLIKRKMPEVHWQAIESRLTGTGVPDLNGCLRTEVWIELKRLSHTGNRFMRALTPRQGLWLHKRHQAGGTCFVLARREQVGDFYLWAGWQARGLAADGPGRVQPIRNLTLDTAEEWATFQTFMFGPPPTKTP